MIGLIMAGGKGTRMNLDNEKLLLEYKKPVIFHVVDSLKESNCFSKILALTSSNSPKTKKNAVRIVRFQSLKTEQIPTIVFLRFQSLKL